MKFLRFVHVAYDRFVWLASFLQSPVLLIIRLYWGWQFFQTGKGKLEDLDSIRANFAEWGVPFPGVSVILAATTECVGGLLLAAGFASRAAALGLSCTMIVAYFTAHIEQTRMLFQKPDDFLEAPPFLFLYT